MKKLTTEEWIAKAILVHGDQYDYSKVIYTKGSEKVTIVCPDHGEVLITAANHINNAAKCPKCSGKYQRSLKELLENFGRVHKNFYSYSNVTLKPLKEKVTITCPIHGDFEQTPESHLSGHGCKQCADIKTQRALSLTTQQFLEKANAIHGQTYDYNKVEYKSMSTLVKIICRIHGEFKQKANNHVNQRQGCPECALIANQGRFLSNTSNFIEKAVSVHKGQYTYEDVTYKGNRVLVNITCSEHGTFQQTPHAHLSGYGCTSCAKYGFDKNKKGLLYILSINDGEAFKVGVTNYTVKRRYPNADLKKIVVIYEKQFSYGLDAFTEEQKILNLFKEYKYTGKPLLSSGNTEILTKGVPWDTYFTTNL